MRYLHPQFRDENLSSRYPFADSASLTSSDGRVLDSQIFLDALLHPPDHSGPLYISSIAADGLLITINIADASGQVLCSGAADAGDITSGSIVLVDNFDRPAGLLLASPQLLGTLQQFATSEVFFEADATAFVASVVVPAPEPGVRGLGAATGAALTNDVWLVGEDGVQVVLDADGFIRIDIVGEPLFRRRICDTSAAFTTPKFVKTINGIPPTYWGGFTIQAGRAASPRPALRVFVEDTAIVVGLATP